MRVVNFQFIDVFLELFVQFYHLFHLVDHLHIGPLINGEVELLAQVSLRDFLAVDLLLHLLEVVLHRLKLFVFLSANSGSWTELLGDLINFIVFISLALEDVFIRNGQFGYPLVPQLINIEKCSHRFPIRTYELNTRLLFI